MAYPYYPNFYSPYGQNLPQQNQPAANQNQNSNIIWVSGEAGAKAYLVAPNTSIQLWDSEAPVIYLKSADASGLPTIRVLEYKERNANATEPSKLLHTEDFATKEDISALRSEIEELRDKIKPKKTIKKGEKDE